MKKLISILLILLLGFVNSEKSYAITLPEDKEDIMDYVYALLQTVEMEKEVYGLEGIELDCLDLGSEIPAFITTYEGLVRQEQLHFLPVLYHEQWVGTLVSSNNKYEELTVEYTRDYSNVTSKAYPIVGKQVAVVFDNRYGYVYIDDKLFIEEEFAEIEDRPIIRDADVIELKTISPIINQGRIAYSSVKSTHETGSIYGAVLSVPSVTQTTNYNCWAACDAAIVRYYGGSATVQQICQKAGCSINTPKTLPQAIYVLEDKYGLWYGRNGSYGLLYSKLVMNYLIKEIHYLSAPIFAGFGGESLGTSGHAVVVRGFINLDGSNLHTMAYMDPKTGTYKVSTVPTSGYVTIIHSGNTLTINSACAVYEYD